MEEGRQSKIFVTAIAFPFVFLIVALCIFLNAMSNYSVYTNTVPVAATVTSVTEDRYLDHSIVYKKGYSTVINYEHNGIQHENINLGYLTTQYHVGDSITVRVDEHGNAKDLDISDVICPGLGALGMGAFGLFFLAKMIGWQIYDLKEIKKAAKGIFCRLRRPSAKEILSGIIILILLATSIYFTITWMNWLLVSDIILGFILLFWADCCLIK